MKFHFHPVTETETKSKLSCSSNNTRQSSVLCEYGNDAAQIFILKLVRFLPKMKMAETIKIVIFGAENENEFSSNTLRQCSDKIHRTKYTEQQLTVLNAPTTSSYTLSQKIARNIILAQRDFNICIVIHKKVAVHL